MPAGWITTCASPLGTLTLTSDGTALTGLWMEGQKYFRATAPGALSRRDDLPVFRAAEDWLARYFRGDRPDLGELPLRPDGSPFRQKVWAVLRAIPYGTVTTYGAIAGELSVRQGGGPVSSQAVGGAVGHNPISIIIPCHRVVGWDGSLTGYAGGVDKKLALLRLEGADLSRLYVPRRGTAL